MDKDKEYKFIISPMTEMYYNEDSMFGVYKFNTTDDIPNVEKFPFDKNLGICPALRSPVGK